MLVGKDRIGGEGPCWWGRIMLLGKDHMLLGKDHAGGEESCVGGTYHHGGKGSCGWWKMLIIANS